MKYITIGLASGLGNTILMLPAIKGVKELGFPVQLYLEPDFKMTDLWRRCRYADSVVEGPAPVPGSRLVCGQWRPASWNQLQNITRFQTHYPYTISEFASNFRIALQLGHVGPIPDTDDWCSGISYGSRYDVGIVPGCKGGEWLRKRWKHMRQVAETLGRIGYRVAVFGLEQDGCAEIPGSWVRASLAELPDALAQCRCVLGTDSGITHLAASLGIPCVWIYTATSTVKGCPLGHNNVILCRRLPCGPCQSTMTWYDCHDWKCQDIEPLEAISAVRKILEG